MTLARRLAAVVLALAVAAVALCYIPEWEPETARRYAAIPLRCRNDGAFHVATTGDDTRGDGTACRPWATLDKAQTVIRTVSPIIPAKVEPGDYWRTSTWALTNADSGTSWTCTGAPATCRVLGGQKLTGCSLYSGSIWRCPHAGQISTLYENGIRADSARTPNRVVNPQFPTSQAPYFTTNADISDHVTVAYLSTDFDPSSWSLTGAQAMLWEGGGVGFTHTNWFTDTLPISSIDTSAHRIHLGASMNYTSATGQRYFIQGVFQLLDQAGEYWDDVANGQVYYWPRSGGDPGLQETVAPTVTRLVSIAGADDAHLAQNITLDGFTFQYSDAAQVLSSAGFDTTGYGLVYLHESDTITLRNLLLPDSGLSGIVADSTHNKNHVIQHVRVEHAGGYGIIGLNSTLTDTVSTWTMNDFQVDYVGELVGGAAGVQFDNSGHHTISHFDISHAPRSGLAIYAPYGTDPSQVYAWGSTISYGHIWQVAENSGDIGAISTSGLSLALPYLFNTYSQIYAHTIATDPSNLDAYPNVVFPDNGSPGQMWDHVHAHDDVGAANYRTALAGDSCCQVTTNVNCTVGATFNGCTDSFDATQMDYANIGTLSTFPFAPTFASGIDTRGDVVIHLVADSIAGNDGDPVATWANQSAWGSTSNYTQATASHRPLLKKNIINGHAVVRPDGVDDTLDTSVTTFVRSTGYTVAMVFQLPAGLASSAHSYLWWLSGNISVGLLFNGVTGYHNVEFCGAGTATPTNYVGFNLGGGFDTHPHLLVITFNPTDGTTTTKTATSSYSAWWDGVQQTITQSTAPISGLTTYPNELTSTGGTPADVAEFAVFRSPLRPQEVSALIATLRAKYGI